MFSVLPTNVAAPAAPLVVNTTVVTMVESAVCTKAVVAICVLLVAPLAVGAVGIPVSAALFKGAFALSAACKPLIWLIDGCVNRPIMRFNKDNMPVFCLC